MSYSVKTGPFPEPPENLRRSIESLRPRWRWIVALGILIACMGVAALDLVVSATIASYDRGFYDRRRRPEIATGLSAKTWRGFVVWISPDLPISSTRPLRLRSPLSRRLSLVWCSARE